jgi:hypothetical protein
MEVILEMDFRQIEQLGDELRSIGHRRRELVQQIYQEVNEGDQQTSIQLYQELSSVSDKAIGIMQRQKQIFDEELGKM